MQNLYIVIEPSSYQFSNFILRILPASGGAAANSGASTPAANDATRTPVSEVPPEVKRPKAAATITPGQADAARAAIEALAAPAPREFHFSDLSERGKEKFAKEKIAPLVALVESACGVGSDRLPNDGEWGIAKLAGIAQGTQSWQNREARKRRLVEDAAASHKR